MEYEKVEELLEKQGYTTERMVEDGNCLFRGASRQLLGDEEWHHEIKYETVEYIIANRCFYSDYELDIEERLFEKLMNRSWGGHMEIDAIAKRYNVGIVIWELSKTGQLVTPISKPRPISSEGPRNLYFVRHRGVHYDCVFQKGDNCCLTKSRSHSKSNYRMKASSSNSLESATISVTPMELDENEASHGGANNTHERSVKGDGLFLQSLHQTTISVLSKKSPRKVDEPKPFLNNTVHDAKDCCMLGCDETERICKDTVKPTSTPHPRESRVETPLDSLEPLPKVTGHTGCESSSESSHDTTTNRTSSSAQKTNETCLDIRNVLCPIPGCKNKGGKGFRRVGISKHIMGQHPKDLERSSVNFSLVDSFLRSLGRKICVICNRIKIRCTVDGFCDKCDKKRPMAGQIVRDLTRNQREKSTAEMLSIQKTNFRLRRIVPRKLYTLWSDLLTDIALGMADAKKESEARRALKRYLMVKAVLI